MYVQARLSLDVEAEYVSMTNKSGMGSSGLNVISSQFKIFFILSFAYLSTPPPLLLGYVGGTCTTLANVLFTLHWCVTKPGSLEGAWCHQLPHTTTAYTHTHSSSGHKAARKPFINVLTHSAHSSCTHCFSSTWNMDLSLTWMWVRVFQEVIVFWGYEYQCCRTVIYTAAFWGD